MIQMVTRCPKCATIFRITSTQLESAKGSVRCGSCLSIFHAQDFLVKADLPDPETTKSTEATKSTEPLSPQPEAENPTQTPAMTSTKPSVAASAPEQDQDEEDQLISDDMHSATTKASAYEFDSFIDLNLQPKTASLFEREIRYQVLEDYPSENADESWTEKLIEVERQAERQASTNAEPPSAQPGTSSPWAQSPASVNARAQENTLELSEIFLQATGATGRANPEPEAESKTSSSGAKNPDPAPTLAEAPRSPTAKRPIKPTSKLRALSSSRAVLLRNIMPAPVEFSAKHIQHWYQEKLWPSLALLAGVLLIGQLAYFKFDYFSRAEPYRSAYVLLCPLLGCQLPIVSDSRQILTSDLIVRNHPSIDNALLVDAILINKSPSAQPFPDLLLTFNRIDTTLVARRRFKPQEYLSGELKNQTKMAANQPIHISLEIADPGPEASNYTLTVP
jgi:predicted Zn finger-like uncharacterized protein